MIRLVLWVVLIAVAVFAIITALERSGVGDFLRGCAA